MTRSTSTVGLPRLSMICLALTDFTEDSPVAEALVTGEGAAEREQRTEGRGRRLQEEGIEDDDREGLVKEGSSERKEQKVVQWVAAKAISRVRKREWVYYS